MCLLAMCIFSSMNCLFFFRNCQHLTGGVGERKALLRFLHETSEKTIPKLGEDRMLINKTNF